MQAVAAVVTTALRVAAALAVAVLPVALARRLAWLERTVWAVVAVQDAIILRTETAAMAARAS
jgi:hypothetical protein